MKLIFATRYDSTAHPGGDSIQLLRIADQMRLRGHEVRVMEGLFRTAECAADLVHVFNLQRPGETARQVHVASRRAPVVISPIFGDTAALDAQGRSRAHRIIHRMMPSAALEIAKQAARVRQQAAQVGSIWPVLSRSPSALRAKLLRECAGIYPNSAWEADVIRRYLRPEHFARCEVVRNGVDTSLVERGETDAWFRRRFNITADRFVLSVARFDERKNNLRLVRAAVASGVPLVMVGRPAPLHGRYFDACRAAASEASHISFIDEPLTPEQLAGAYRATHAHVLPSWLETPGLVSLEAGLFGANLVLGDCVPVREYFGSSAWYTQPGDESSIARALKEALCAPRDAYGLSELVRREYSWHSVAEAQLRSYQRALSGTV